jgi:hypothetical protein
MRTKTLSTPYFPKVLMFTSPLFIGGGILLIIDHEYIWGIILILVAIVLLTTKYSTEINLDKKEFSDYLLFLTIEFNAEIGTFDCLDKITITKGNHAYSGNTRSRARTVQFADYSATLVFNNGNNTLDLLTLTDKRKLIKRIKDMAIFLSIPVEDCSTPSHYIIDLAKVE